MREGLARGGKRLPFELAAPDRAVEGPVRPHDHARAGLSGRRALRALHGDERGGAVLGDHFREAAPDNHGIGLPRTASQARRIASGVAGASRGTGLSGASERIASAMAQKTLIASISGGSPTAFER